MSCSSISDRLSDHWRLKIGVSYYPFVVSVELTIQLPNKAIALKGRAQTIWLIQAQAYKEDLLGSQFDKRFSTNAHLRYKSKVPFPIVHAGPGGALSRDQFQISPPASPELLHRTVWRTWLFVAHSDEKWFIFLLPIEFSLPRLYDISLWKVWTTYFYLAMKWSNKPIILSRHVWTVYFIVSSAKRASVGAKRALQFMVN